MTRELPYTVVPTGEGLPDYSAPAPLGQISVGPVHTLTNLAEAAVRLGSIVTFDRRGDVVWFDDFESGLVTGKWENMIHVSPGVVVASNTIVRNGVLSARFTGNALAPTGTGIHHFERFPVIGLVGIEASFTLQVNLDRVEYLSDFFDGTNQRFFGIRYNQTTQQLEYLDNGGLWVALATGLDIYGYLSLFHTIKLIIDLNTNQYVRCLLDDVAYPMAGITGQVGAAPAAVPCWRVRCAQYSDTVGSVVNYMDDVILTQNEPERSLV